MISDYLYLKAGGLELKPRPRGYFEDGLSRDNENHILFLCEYVFLCDMLGRKDQVEELKPFFVQAKSLLQVPNYPGLYNRGYGPLAFNEATGEKVDISFDNMTGFACLNYFYFGNCDEIMTHLKKSKFRIDNIQPEKPRWRRILHPRDVIFLSYLVSNYWASLALPLLIVDAILSCGTKWVIRPTLYQKVWNLLYKTGLSAPYRDVATSGKCLWFIRLYVTRNRIWGRATFKLCEFVMKKFTGLDFIDALRLYFAQRTTAYHPIIELCDEIKGIKPTSNNQVERFG